jgi:HAD superfamily hydrolase (TIGR01509 family)
MTNLKAIIFDMDGVLIDARDWHFEALNEALSYFGSEISYAEHLERFDGLPTARKLNILSAEGRLPNHVHGIVEAIKQERTLRKAALMCYPSMRHLVALGWIRSAGLRIGVATNSVRSTSTTMLSYAGIIPLIDCLVTNQDVRLPKPDPEIYLEACSRLGVIPEETLVFEDNENGIASATTAGCNVAIVEDPESVNLSRIKFEISKLGI